MIRGLFWNICGPGCPPGSRRYQRLTELLQRAVRDHALDLVLLAESPFEGSWHADGFTERPHNVPPNRSTKCRLEVYAAQRLETQLLRDFDRATIFEVRTPSLTFLLTLAHLTSKIQTEIDDLNEEVRTFSSGIQHLERESKNTKTILVGDLNHEPYEFCIQNANGLHAISSQEIAATESRTIKGQDYPFFYNPMWRCYGGTPSGTYYRKTYGVNCQFWYIPDQVLVRPALLENWDESVLRILDQIGDTRLVNERGEPLAPPSKYRDSRGISDHLPLLFALKETKQ